MILRFVRNKEMFLRARDFGLEHADLFPPDSLGGKLFAKLSKAIDRLSEFGASQVSGQGASDGGSTSKAVRREALRARLDKIGYTARAIAVDTPGIDDKFRVGRGISDQRLLNAARAFARDAAPTADTFIEHGLPADFLAELNTTIQKFEQAIHDHAHGKDSRIAARAGIESVMASAFAAIRKLDAVVANRLDDPSLIAFWEAARRVDRLPRRRKGGPDPAPSPSPAPAPPSTPTMP